MTTCHTLLVASLLLCCLVLGSPRADEGKPMPVGVGFYGSPTLLWEKGFSLRDSRASVVIVGHQAVTPEMVERCHAEGLRILADFSLFVGAEIAEQHPELWPIGSDGERLEKEDWYLGLCPVHDWFRKEKLLEIRDFLRQMPVDGICLDFIRWPCHWEGSQPKTDQSCFCDVALSRFSQDKELQVYGHSTRQKAGYVLRHHRGDWAVWKAEQITDFVRQVREVVWKTRPEALVGIFTVPWKPGEYDNAIIEVIGQDFGALAEYVDVFSPMLYHAMCGREVGWVKEYTNWLAEATGKAVWPIVQATNDGRAVSPEELTEILHQALSPGGGGVLVFTLEALLQEPKKLEAAGHAFEQFKEGSQ